MPDVGPFFYINNQIKALTIDITKGEVIGDFINHPTSHFEFFNTFNNDQYLDYGNFSRGRVIYNRIAQLFIVYLDASLFKEDIKKVVINKYKLKGEKVVFRYDSHYQHNEL